MPEELMVKEPGTDSHVEELIRKYHDYKLFREYLIKCLLEDKSWDMEKTTPLDDWARELVIEVYPNLKDNPNIYVDYESGDIIISRGDDNNDLFVLSSFWGLYYMHAIYELSDRIGGILTAKQAFRIFEKIVGVIQEIDTLAAESEPIKGGESAKGNQSTTGEDKPVIL